VKRTCPLGAIVTVTGTDGEPYIAYLGHREQSLRLTPATARESAAALIAAADEIEGTPVQGTLDDAA
jgi:hypothetical protein